MDEIPIPRSKWSQEYEPHLRIRIKSGDFDKEFDSGNLISKSNYPNSNWGKSGERSPSVVTFDPSRFLALILNNQK